MIVALLILILAAILFPGALRAGAGMLLIILLLAMAHALPQ